MLKCWNFEMLPSKKNVLKHWRYFKCILLNYVEFELKRYWILVSSSKGYYSWNLTQFHEKLTKWKIWVLVFFMCSWGRKSKKSTFDPKFYFKSVKSCIGWFCKIKIKNNDINEFFLKY